jgi:HK97 family phage major capsid protein
MATVSDLSTRQEEITERLKEIGAEFQAKDMDDETRAEWNNLNEELEANIKSIEERKAVEERIRALSNKPENTETAQMPATRGKRVVSNVPDDPTRIEEYRNLNNTMDDLEQAYRDGAMKIIERFRPAHPDVTREKAQDNVARLLDTVDTTHGDDGPRAIARRVIATSSPGYAKEFGTYLRSGGRVVGKEMERAASLTTTAGGYAVPVVLDPSVILVSSGVVNPIRQLARVVQISGNTWEGITSTGITAAYGAEVTETSDNAPTLVQPVANVEKAQAFVPFSIEIGEDWGAFQSEMSMMFADAKDTLENTKFLTGIGHASTEPLGLIAPLGATAVVTSASTATIAVGDLYNLEAALSERWLARASIVGNRAAFAKIRQLDTAGGANLWVQLQYSDPPTLLGYPAYQWSAYSSAVTTSASTVLTIGDFSQYLIVDRVGMGVEVIPHMFATANNRPSGQRGLYMYWRNTGRPLTPALQANSAFVSLKLL